MGRKTNKSRRQAQANTARERAAAARAIQQRAEQRRRAMVILGSVVGVAVLVVVIALVAINHKSATDKTKGSQKVAVAPAVLSQARSVSDATYTSVGKGNVASPPDKVTGKPLLTVNGKPDVLYIGAEFCPYCAIERWSLYAALSKFGTFSGVGAVHSALDDGNYASLDFYKSTYTSQYVTFSSVENQNRNSLTLETPSSAQNTLWKFYSTSSTYGDGSQGFPFIDIGNKFVMAKNAPLDPTVLGKSTQAQIAAQLNNPKSKVALEIDGETNYLTAAICSMTNNKPANVCSASTITSLQSTLNA